MRPSLIEVCRFGATLGFKSSIVSDEAGLKLLFALGGFAGKSSEHREATLVPFDGPCRSKWAGRLACRAVHAP